MQSQVQKCLQSRPVGSAERIQLQRPVARYEKYLQYEQLRLKCLEKMPSASSSELTQRRLVLEEDIRQFRHASDSINCVKDVDGTSIVHSPCEVLSVDRGMATDEHLLQHERKKRTPRVGLPRLHLLIVLMSGEKVVGVSSLMLA